MPVPGPDDPLRIAFLVYRGSVHVGGQGVYTRHLTRALVALGHEVEVFSGPPYPVLDEGVRFTKVPSLELFEPPHPFRAPAPWELKTSIDWAEWGLMSLAGFPEPYTYSLRVKRLLLPRRHEFDVVHDNQTLGTGILPIQAAMPMLGTIHHPITVDRRLELAHAKQLAATLGRYVSLRRQLGLHRWYGFTRMQARVAKQLDLILTVSENSLADIVTDLGVAPDRLRVVHVGVDPEHFRPLPHIARVPGRLMTTTSSDVPLKGLVHLLEAVAKLRTERPEITLTVIGAPRTGGAIEGTIERLGIEDLVRFETGVSDERLVELYAEAQLAVVPSLYEGFSLPAVEAQAAGVPLVATTGGALPEVVGRDGTTAVLVPPADPGALAATIAELLDDPDRRAAVGEAGRRWAVERYSWTVTAAKTAELYREVIALREHSRPC
jgi:glycosyltransferase involved in cell wall biosynthesis